MAVFSGKKVLYGVGAFVGVWLGVKYILPVVTPFLLGGLLALAAEPVVRLGTKKGHLPRSVAAPIGVSAVLLSLMALLSVAGAVLVRELGELIKALPNVQQTAQEGIQIVKDYLVHTADSAPEGVRPMLTDAVLHFFEDGTAVMDTVLSKVSKIIGTVLASVPDSALSLGTGVLAGYMISARLPYLKGLIAEKAPEKWKSAYLPALRRIRRTLGGWLKAQLTLALVTYCIVTVGFLLMKIPFAPAWAALVAAVDAVPLLGTGTLLGPCAIVCMLQGNVTRGLWYLGIYGVAVTVRTVLEPKLVGRHLGLDPLATLFVIYVGYRFWGFLGLILAPMLASAIIQLINVEKN